MPEWIEQADSCEATVAVSLRHERQERLDSSMLPRQERNRRLLDLPVDAEPIIVQDLGMCLPVRILRALIIIKQNKNFVTITCKTKY